MEDPRAEKIEVRVQLKGRKITITYALEKSKSVFAACI